MPVAFASPLSRYLGLSLLYLALVWAAYQLHRKGYLARPLHRDLLAIGILAWLTLAFFYQVAFDTDTFVPAGGGDLAVLLYPNYHFAAESFKQGIIPLWNPYLYGGYPFAADIQSSLFYPINVLFFLLSPEVSYHSLEFMAALHVFLAGAFMYLMMRNLGPGGKVDCLASLVAALAYMLSDFFIVHLGNLNLIAAAAWLPLVFLGLHRGLSQERPVLAALGGVFLGFTLLAGHVQPFLYLMLMAALYLLYRLYLVWQEGGRFAEAARAVALFALFMAVALGTTALQLLPAYELSQHSIRPDLPYAESIEYSLPPAQLVSLLVPGFFGRGPETYWGPWERVETGYLGVLPLVLAVVALALRRVRLAGLLALLAVFSLLVALGGYGVIQGWLYRFFPGFDTVRAHARMVFVFSFAVAALAGLGAQALLEPISQRGRRSLAKLIRYVTIGLAVIVVAVLPALLLFSNQIGNGAAEMTRRLSGISTGLAIFAVLLGGSLALLWARRHRFLPSPLLGVLAVAWVALDLIGNGFNIDVGAGEPMRNFDHPAVIDFLRQDADLYRVDTITDVWDVWQPNATLLYRVYDVMGGYNPLLLADTEHYWATMGSRSTPLYDMLNAKYIIGHKGVPLDWDKWVLAFDGDPQVNVYRNIKVMPRAFLVGRTRVFADREALFAALHEPDFDPSGEVLLEEGNEVKGEVQGGWVKVITHSPNGLGMEVESDGPAYLVLSETYYPGWRASIDGQPAEVLRADYRFRAVALEAGQHQVKMSFEPDSWRLGAFISGLTWAGLAGWGAWRLVTWRKRSASKS